MYIFEINERQVYTYRREEAQAWYAQGHRQIAGPVVQAPAPTRPVRDVVSEAAPARAGPAQQETE